jgi:hypothetical protein
MIISGFYLYIEGQEIWNKSRHLVSKTLSSSTSLDVHTPDTPAPDTPERETRSELSETTEKADSNGRSPLAMPLTQPLTLNEITDRVQKSAMAPLPLSTPTPQGVTQLERTGSRPESFMVQVHTVKANIHSGPGLQFPVIGTAIPNGRYPVADWNNRWFKVILATPQEMQAKELLGHTQFGWIRNDMVQTFSRQNL